MPGPTEGQKVVLRRMGKNPESYKDVPASVINKILSTANYEDRVNRLKQERLAEIARKGFHETGRVKVKLAGKEAICTIARITTDGHIHLVERRPERRFTPQNLTPCE